MIYQAGIPIKIHSDIKYRSFSIIEKHQEVTPTYIRFSTIDVNILLSKTLERSSNNIKDPNLPL
jgi:hypothetical protein